MNTSLVCTVVPWFSIEDYTNELVCVSKSTTRLTFVGRFFCCRSQSHSPRTPHSFRRRKTSSASSIHSFRRVPFSLSSDPGPVTEARGRICVTVGRLCLWQDTQLSLKTLFSLAYFLRLTNRRRYFVLFSLLACVFIGV